MKWKKVWEAVPVNYGTVIGCLENVLLRMRIKVNAQSENLRVVFSNRYGNEEMEISAAFLSQAGNTENIFTYEENNDENRKSVYLKGNKLIKIPAGSLRVSDAVPVRTKSGSTLILDLFFRKRTPISSVVMTWSDKTWSSAFFRVIREELTNRRNRNDWNLLECKEESCFRFITCDTYEKKVMVGVEAILAEVDDSYQTLWLWGDSLTHMGFYSDPLMDLLVRKHPGHASILNYGINGNRLLTDAPLDSSIPGHGLMYGEAGLQRLMKKLEGDEKPQILFLLEGANDCLLGFRYKEKKIPDIFDFITAYNKIFSVCVEMNIYLLVGTIPPLNVSGEIWGSRAEALRSEVNKWIRTWFVKNNIVDVDKIVGDSEDPLREDPTLCLADGLHPNAKGGQKIAQGVYGAIKPLLK